MSVRQMKSAAGRDEQLAGRRNLRNALGDALILLVFVLIGRANHQESEDLSGIVATLLPFALFWFLLASLLGALTWGERARESRLQALLLRTLVAWVVACPLAVVTRAALLHHEIKISFGLVAFTFNAVLLLGWRVITALLDRRA